MKAFGSRFARARQGGIAMIAALAAPVVLMLTFGAIDLYAVKNDIQRIQDVADSSALLGALELRVAKEGVEERVKAAVAANLPPDLLMNVATQVTITPEGEVRVLITGRRRSYIGNLLPPGGWPLKGDATAASMNMVPLCVLAHGHGDDKTLNLLDTSQLSAGKCLVHTNGGVVAEGVSWLRAGLVHSAKDARGRISPTPSIGAGVVEDPFASMAMPVGPCTTSGKSDTKAGASRLKAGVHCGKVEVGKGMTLTLEPGEHIFNNAELNVKEDGVLLARDVVIILGQGSKVKFQDTASVDLEGRQSGPYAGFVLIATRDNTNDLEIWSDNVDNLLGVVYAPSAKIMVLAEDAVAEESDWTVIVAKELQLKGAAKLTINTDYASSLTPVPEGVGNNGATRLIR